MRYRKLPQNLRQKISDYYEHRYHRKFFNEEAILSDLSQGLREVRTVLCNWDSSAEIITSNVKALLQLASYPGAWVQGYAST